MKYKAHINGEEWSLTKENDTWMVNGHVVSLDSLSTGSGSLHVLSANTGYRIEILSVDEDSKTLTVRLNGKKALVRLEDEQDLLLAGLGMQNAGKKIQSELKAPMPGLVVEILVQAGDQVEKGQPLVILEAMKMENVLKAGHDVTIKNVVAQKGNAVEKNQILLEFA